MSALSICCVTIYVVIKVNESLKVFVQYSLIHKYISTTFFRYLCIYVTAKKPNFPERFQKESEYSGTKFKQADDKISQTICWQNAWRTKKKKKKREKWKRKRQFLMDNVTNLFRRKRMNQLSMYDNFQYEKIVWIFILFLFYLFFGGFVYHFFVFLNNLCTYCTVQK